MRDVKFDHPYASIVAICRLKESRGKNAETVLTLKVHFLFARLVWRSDWEQKLQRQWRLKALGRIPEMVIQIGWVILQVCIAKYVRLAVHECRAMVNENILA